VIKVREKLYVLESAKFFKDVQFKKNVEIDGTLTVADAIVDCDVTVGCNINMHNSLDSSIGNIIKDGDSFIHNFGVNNTYIGLGSGNFTTTGQGNTSCGALSLPVNTSGLYNAGMGGGTLMSNSIGSGNTALGTAALLSNISGDVNTAVGFISMITNTSGVMNTAVGSLSLGSNTSGSSNTAVGSEALSQNVTGSNNVALGRSAGTILVSGDNNVYIANPGAVSETGTMRIGTNFTHTAAFMAGVRGTATGIADAIPVLIDSAGQLGTISSSRRFKHDITDMDAQSANIYQLRPVTFAYNSDAKETKQYGLIAEEVNAVFPEIVVKDADGQPETVQYQVLPVLLLNEVQKLQAGVNAEKVAREALAERVAHLEARA
jgi:hypothetical protein